MSKPKILVFDIETKPNLVYAWGLWDQNISIGQIVEPSAPICFSAKFVGEKEIFFYSDWEDGHSEMVKALHGLLMEADAVVTYNGDKFDIPKMRGEFLLEGLSPLPPLTSIDILKTVRKFGFVSNKLEFIGTFLEIGRKIKNEGFGLWVKVMNGDAAAQKRMKRYCIGDSVLTEKVYTKLKGHIPNHPHLGEVVSEACGSCGSHRVQKRGVRRTKSFTIQRLQCQDCGSWSDGARKKITNLPSKPAKEKA